MPNQPKQKDVLKPDETFASSVMPRRRTNWSAIITILFLVAGGLAFAGFQILAPAGPDVELPEAESPAVPEGMEPPVEEALETEEVPAEVPTAEEAAFAWRDATLAGTPFVDLPVKETDDGVYLVYEAQSGESIPAVVGRYSAAAGMTPEKESELVTAVTDLHREAFQRALWPGDELLLPVPEAVITAEPAPQLEEEEMGTEEEEPANP